MIKHIRGVYLRLPIKYQLSVKYERSNHILYIHKHVIFTIWRHLSTNNSPWRHTITNDISWCHKCICDNDDTILCHGCICIHLSVRPKIQIVTSIVCLRCHHTWTTNVGANTQHHRNSCHHQAISYRQHDTSIISSYQPIKITILFVQYGLCIVVHTFYCYWAYHTYLKPTMTLFQNFY